MPFIANKEILHLYYVRIKQDDLKKDRLLGTIFLVAGIALAIFISLLYSAAIEFMRPLSEFPYFPF